MTSVWFNFCSDPHKLLWRILQSANRWSTCISARASNQKPVPLSAVKCWMQTVVIPQRKQQHTGQNTTMFPLKPDWVGNVFFMKQVKLGVNQRLEAGLQTHLWWTHALDKRRSPLLTVSNDVCCWIKVMRWVSYMIIRAEKHLWMMLPCLLTGASLIRSGAQGTAEWTSSEGSSLTGARYRT